MAKKRRKKPKSTSKWVLLASGFMLLLMTVGFMIPPDTGTQNQETIPPTIDDDEIRGNPYAPVTIISFSDYECDFCKDSESTIEQILFMYPEQVRFVFRDFPLRDKYPNSEKAAEAAECAGEQGKYYEYHDKLFENQGALGVDNLKQYAADLGLDTTTFNTCLDSGAMSQEVQTDRSDGLKAGVEGVPTFFINGKKLVGSAPFQSFQALIDEELM
jgi:protein-disulfide isomerase